MEGSDFILRPPIRQVDELEQTVKNSEAIKSSSSSELEATNKFMNPGEHYQDQSVATPF